MTELDLDNFLNDEEIEHRWQEHKGKMQFLIWIPYYLLDEFMGMVDDDYLSEGGIDVNLQKQYVCIDVTGIAEYHDIDLENILKKEDD